MNTPEETHDPNSPAPPGDDQIRAEIQPSLHSRRPKLPSLEIPSRTPHSLSSSNTPNSSKIGLPPRPSSAKIASKPPGRNPRKNLTPESEKTGLLLSSPPLMESSREKASTSRSFSLTRVFSYSMGKGIHSMPATPASGSSHGHVIDISVLEPKEAKKPIIRSLSVPGTTKAGSLNRMNSMGGRFRVVHANPSPNTADSSSLDESDTKKPEMGAKIMTMRRSRKSSSTKLSVPTQFRCPISDELMVDPVTLSSGITYDRRSIETWLADGHVTCPVTNCTLPGVQHLTPNIALLRTIQDWCLANRIPLPRVPLSEADVSALLSEFSLSIESENLPQCILLAGKITSLANENETNKVCFLSNGAAAAFTAAFLRFPAEETLAALAVTFPLDESLLARLSAPEAFLSLVNIIGHGGLAARLNAVRLLKYLVQSDVAVAASASMVNGMARALVSFLRDLVSEKVSRPALVAVFYMASSKEEIASDYASLGLVPLLLDALVDCDNSTAEKITAVLDVICDSSRGKVTVYEHALAVPLLVKKILRVSVLTTEFSVSVLSKLCKSDEDDEGESNERAERCVTEALQAGAFQKLALLLQVGCGDATKEKASVLLKLLNGPRKVDCSES